MNQNSKNKLTSVQRRKIENVIFRNYSIATQTLNLYNLVDLYLDVLQSRDWSCLITIDLQNCEVDDNGARVISQLRWPFLKHLKLYRNNITSVGVYQLMKNDWPALEHLDLDHNHIQDDGVLMILRKKLNILRDLYLGVNNLTHQSISLMTQYDLTLIQQLSLYKNNLGCIAAKLFTRINLPRLKKFLIYENRLQNQGTRHFMKANLPSLIQLHLNQNWIGYDGFDSLKLNNWKKLSTIQVYEAHHPGMVQQILNPIHYMNILVYNWPKISAQSLLSVIGNEYNILQMYFKAILKRIIVSKFGINSDNN